MFTGIVEELGSIKAADSTSLTISSKKINSDMTIGDSISVNGVCLTVTSFDDSSFKASVMPETIKRTNLGSLSIGDKVNLEWALAYGKRMGGHMVQGHIDAVGKYKSIRPEGNALLVDIEIPAALGCYVAEKGFIAVDGVSLTVVKTERGVVTVSLVEHTRDNTRFHLLKRGDAVNIEVDITAKYIENFIKGPSSKLTMEKLEENGFLS